MFKLRDSRGRVPFNVAKDKETRIEFRRFMASYPNKFDYKKAQVGINGTNKYRVPTVLENPGKSLNLKNKIPGLESP